MSGFYDANYNITKLSKDGEGNIIELELNGKAVEIGSATLENNKTATIDVSTYTEPVEITPTSGKDGMKKATVTLSNIPSVNAFSKDTPSFVTSLSTLEYVVLLLDSNGKFISDLTTETIDTIILVRNSDFRVITKQTEANLSNKYEVILEDDVPSSLYADCEITYTNGVISYTNSDIQTTNTIELTSTTPTNISLLQCITSYRYS
ncbi:MAG: hypothetical protein J6S85_11615 [Methanobrevibacter sp.]|nr:hypothetical protein [Methanobrevibacter sp.]